MKFDDEAETTPPKILTASRRLNLDDAFSDTDDNDPSLEFSAEAVRKEMQETMLGNSWQAGRGDEAREFAAEFGFSVKPNASVSTLDMIASPPPLHRSLSDSSETPSRQSEQDSFYDVQLSSPTQDTELSDDPPFPPLPHTEPEHHAQHVTVEDRSADYPVIQIDVSEPEWISVEVKSSSPTLRTPTEVAVRATSHEEMRSQTPMSSKSPRSAASTSSLPQTVTMPNYSISQQNTPTGPRLSQPPTPSASMSTMSFHKPARSMGPSILDKVVSKTRPNFLPPKDRKEDRKHLQDWETMMKLSRAAEQKRRKTFQQRRYERERQIEESIHIWEREIVPDWTVVHRNPKLRKLWWQGIPTKLRATMWQHAVGNALILGKDSYRSCIARAKRALAAGTFPTTVLGLIDQDIATTLPSLRLFDPHTGPLSQDLKDMLCAWTVSRSDETLGYIPGIAKVCAMLLINMSASEGFIVLKNLLERHCLRSFYSFVCNDKFRVGSSVLPVTHYGPLEDDMSLKVVPEFLIPFLPMACQRVGRVV